MHHSMLPLIISCTRSLNFGWHLLRRSTTESKSIVKLLAISQTIHIVCCEDDFFPKGKFKLFNGLFHSVYLVFPKSLFSIANLLAVRYLWDVWDVCNEDKRCVVTQRAADIPVAWLVYVSTYCVPIPTLNQNKRFGRRPNNKQFSPLESIRLHASAGKSDVGKNLTSKRKYKNKKELQA